MERYVYTAYGEVTVLEADGVTERSVSAVGNPYLFTGRRLDAETGLFYFRARYYSGEQGRFISRDPVGYVDGIDVNDPDSTNTMKALIYGGRVTTPKAGDGYHDGMGLYGAYFGEKFGLDPSGMGCGAGAAAGTGHCEFSASGSSEGCACKKDPVSICNAWKGQCFAHCTNTYDLTSGASCN